MIAVSQEFQNAMFSDIAAPAFQVNLVLGNYAASGTGTTIASSGDDASGNYPASGAIDGDRTEINIGAAATSDNGVGKSSWKSATTPSVGSPVTLTLTFPASTTFTRVKLYNLYSDPLTSYKLEYWNGSAWVIFAGTPDQFTPTNQNSGWGYPQYGGGPWGGAGNGGWPGLGYTGMLDVYDFAAITSTKIKLTVYTTKNSDPAQVVELEVYNVIDITSRVTGYKIDRKKDFKLSNPIATTLDLSIDNTDQFFSIAYTPTAAQVTAGYVNSQLAALAFDIELNEGFVTTAGVELIRTFTGNADAIINKAKGARAEIQCRDYMKQLINHQDSTNLQTSVDLSVGANPYSGVTGAIQYALNRCNISNYEMNLFSTGVTLAYFFFFEQQVLTAIQDLVQAAGSAIFFFDESGYATFQYYLGATPQQGETNTQSGWQAGTLTNIDALSQPSYILREWFLIDNFADGDYTSNPAWTTYTAGSNNHTFSVISNVFNVGDSAGGESVAATPFTQGYGTWSFKLQTAQSVTSVVNMEVYLMSSTASASFPVTASRNGYMLLFEGSNSHVYLVRQDGTSTTNLIDCGAILDTSQHTWAVTRTAAGVFTVYRDGAQVGGTATDTTYTSTSYFLLSVYTAVGGDSGTIKITNIYWTNAVDSTSTPTNAQAVWISPSIDQGATVSVEGTLQDQEVTPVGTSVTWYTRTSSDNSTWNAWTLATVGSQIPSPPLRYLQLKAVLNAPQDDGNHNASTSTPIVQNVTANWSTGTGQSQWSSSVNFVLTDDNAILDLELAVTDNLGGDTAVINDIAVTSAPLVLTGAATNTVWQATAGSPPAAVSASNPLQVSVGTVTFNITVAGGVDTSGMSGGSAIAMTLGTAVATAAITYVHPTKPILVLTVTTGGTITDLRLIGKAFSNAQTPYQATSTDSHSIQAHKRRHQDVQNNYIVSSGVAGIIATRYISNFKSPTTYAQNIKIMPKPNMQAGDRMTLVNTITGLDTDYYAIGFSRSVSVSEKSATAEQQVIALPVNSS